MTRFFIVVGVVSQVVAAPLEVEEFAADGKTSKFWPLPGASGIVIAPGGSALVAIPVAKLSDKEREAGGSWRGVLAVDVHGTATGSPTRLKVEAMEPHTGEVFAQAEATGAGVAPRAAWRIIASSAQPGSEAAKAFDGDPKTDWHSSYQNGKQTPLPHWLGLEFGQPTRVGALCFTPRQGGFTNGVPKGYRVEVRPPGGQWQSVVNGTTDREFADKRKPLELTLPTSLEVDAVRFVIEGDWSGGGFGTAAELEVVGVKLPPVVPVAASGRTWVEISSKLMQALEGKRLVMRVTNAGDAALVVGRASLSRLHEAPSGRLFGRSNGGLGPDKLGAGLLGFDALTEHEQPALTVMEVRSNSPAAAAGLKPGDAIIAVAGEPLPFNRLDPSWEWFRFSHEAVLGRASEAALRAGSRKLLVTVLRNGKPQDLTLDLPKGRHAGFSSLDPATDHEAAAMLKDCIAFLERTQREDGSWSGDMIRTSFSALALLATGDKAQHARVAKAVEWAKTKFPKPEAYGNLGFWSGGYAGILYAEWHLATGDPSVVPHMAALRDWAVAGQHMSIWKVPALGHGPSGLPYGDKALVAPACHLLVAEALAKRCKVKSGIWELLLPYMEMAWSDPKEGGHGALGYNRSLKDTEEFWSRTGLFAMAAHLRGERTDMRDAMIRFMPTRHPWLRNSHAYGEPGGALGLLGLNLCAPASYRKVVADYGWWFSLAWEPGHGLRFTTPHMGAPYMGEEDLINAAYALVLQGPRRTLHLTGKR